MTGYHLTLSPRAQQDLADARDFLERQYEELGKQLGEQVERSIRRIEQNPLASTIVDEGIRRVLTHRFPYGVYFKVVEQQIRVIGIIHQSRDPSAWRGRT